METCCGTGIEVIHIPDAYHTDEVAFMVHGEGNTMIVGDAVCGGRKDRGIPDGEIWINAPEYVVAGLSDARESLRKLAGHSFEKMAFRTRIADTARRRRPVQGIPGR